MLHIIYLIKLVLTIFILKLFLLTNELVHVMCVAEGVKSIIWEYWTSICQSTGSAKVLRWRSVFKGTIYGTIFTAATVACSSKIR